MADLIAADETWGEIRAKINALRDALKRNLGRKIDPLGDSISAQQREVSTSYQNYPLNACWVVGNELAGSPVTEWDNHGVSGETSTQIAARASSVSEYAFVPMLMGTNDIQAMSTSGDVATTVSAVTGNILTSMSAVLERYSLPGLTTIPPSAAYTGNRIAALLEINRWIRRTAAELGLECLDMFEALVDPASTTAAPRTGVLYDTSSPFLHPSALGGFLAGLKAATIIRRVFGNWPISQAASGAADVSTVNSAITNIVDNPALVQGVGGLATPGTGTITGTIPELWRILISSGSPTVDCQIIPYVSDPNCVMRGAWVTTTYYGVGDCVTSGGTTYRCTRTHYSGTFATDLAAGFWTPQETFGNMVELSITGATAGTSLAFYGRNNIATRWVNGRYVQPMMDIELMPGASGIKQVYLNTQWAYVSSVGGNAVWRSQAGLPGRGEAVAADWGRSWRRRMVGPKVFVDPAGGGLTGSQNGIACNIDFLGSGSAKVRIAAPALIQSIE